MSRDGYAFCLFNVDGQGASDIELFSLDGEVQSRNQRLSKNKTIGTIKQASVNHLPGFQQ